MRWIVSGSVRKLLKNGDVLLPLDAHGVCFVPGKLCGKGNPAPSMTWPQLRIPRFIDFPACLESPVSPFSNDLDFLYPIIGSCLDKREVE